MNSEEIIVKCISCGTGNRIPRDRLNDRPVCGRCHTPISKTRLYDSPMKVTDQTFSQEVIKFDGSVVADFWAPWCGPCGAITPVLEQLARKYAGRVKIVKLNVDENPVTASQYNVMSIPTMLFFKNGNTIDTLVGAHSRGEIEKRLLSII